VLALGDCAKEDKPVDQLGAASGEPAGCDAASGMCDDRKPLHAMMSANEADRLFDLPAGILSAAEWRMGLSRLRHLGIGIGQRSETVKSSPHT
jgi:hypothetical protein